MSIFHLLSSGTNIVKAILVPSGDQRRLEGDS
jgi:hypothetical protein